jgi:SAM-dependent methyltransferase
LNRPEIENYIFVTSLKDNHDLAGNRFWDAYWEKLRLPCVINEDFSFDRCLSRVLRKRLGQITLGQSHDGKSSVFEIGAAPGKWLTLFPPELYSVSGLDYSERGLQALRRNLELLGIKPWRLYEGDFFKVEPSMSFDVVLSLGFVEHFDDPMLVIRRHLDWLLPNGVLIIGVPNFTGLHGLFQRMLDPTVLAKHNTSIMTKSFFDELERSLNIQQLSCDYLGSFEPALPMTYNRTSMSNIFPKAFLRAASFARKWPHWDHFNSPFFSSYILTFYRKTC